jgi:hypothetical protein
VLSLLPTAAVGCSLKVHFKDSDGNLIKTVEANEGDDILAIAHEYDVDLEGASGLTFSFRARTWTDNAISFVPFSYIVHFVSI